MSIITVNRPDAPELLPYAKIREDLFRPLSGMTKKYFVAILIPLLVILFGAYEWFLQLRDGMGVTGLAALPGVSEAAKALASQVLEAVGTAVWFDEEGCVGRANAG